MPVPRELRGASERLAALLIVAITLGLLYFGLRITNLDFSRRIRSTRSA